MPLPFADPVSFTVRYIRPQVSLAEVEAWCALHGLVPCRIEGPCPDGLFRGTCTPEPEKPDGV